MNIANKHNYIIQLVLLHLSHFYLYPKVNHYFIVYIEVYYSCIVCLCKSTSKCNLSKRNFRISNFLCHVVIYYLRWIQDESYSN